MTSLRVRGNEARRFPSSRLARTLAPYGFISPTAVLIIVLMVIPIVMVIGYSLLDNVIAQPESKFVGLANYIAVFTDPNFLNAVKNTLVFTLSSVIAHLVIGLGFALMLNSPLLGRLSRATFRVIFILPWLFTAAIIAILWRLILDPNGVINFLLQQTGVIHEGIAWFATPSTALLAVTVMNIWGGYPFFMISLLAGLQGIPRDLYEAATVDGASWFDQFRNVTLPQLRPIILSMATLDLLWTTQQFALIWLTTGGGPVNLTEMLSTFTYKLAFSNYEFSQASASAVIILLGSLVVAFFYVRQQRAQD
ncbi:carbohydrate ABC transporter permease [Lysinimonas soli]|uniref:Carbohydrate ABC transporter permease n=1 Tax=Lysinimonas soli TaxID=1074233 RepID=A0ABW0NQG5_9MICO